LSAFFVSGAVSVHFRFAINSNWQQVTIEKSSPGCPNSPRFQIEMHLKCTFSAMHFLLSTVIG
jgi:hypothetical protein